MQVYSLFVTLCLLANICPSWSKSLEQRLAFYDGILLGVRLLDPIRSVLPSVDFIPSKAIDQCYDRLLNGVEVDVFQANISTFQVLINYYKSQPTKNVTLNSIENLIGAARVITRHVAECSVKPKSYKMGFTSMSDKSLEEFQQFMTGYKEVPASNETDPRIFSSSCYAPNSFRAPSRLNWVDHGIVTPVRHQGQCASCWAFSVVATLESAYLKKHHKTLDLSEQQLVDCASRGSGESSNECSSGTSYMAFRYIYHNGLASEENYPYQASHTGCPSLRPPWQAALNGYCIRGLNWYGSSSGTAYERVTDSEMEKAVAYFGPISVCFNSDLLQHYKGGIIDDPNCPKKITHMVLLVGYTQREWLLKNSWGTNWGERGYFRLARGKNMCNINFEIAFPLV